MEYRYTAMLIGVSIYFSGCVRPYMVRECGAIVGDHFNADEYAWVQPCDRKDIGGCEASCRPAHSACETDYAMYRDPKLWLSGPPYYVKERDARKNLDEINRRIGWDCPK